VNFIPSCAEVDQFAEQAAGFAVRVGLGALPIVCFVDAPVFVVFVGGRDFRGVGVAGQLPERVEHARDRLWFAFGAGFAFVRTLLDQCA
jgi:hypothetical protein